MTEPSLTEKAATVRANILADTMARAVRWLCFVAIVGGLAAPLAWGAMRERGIVPGLVVMALCVALAWHVKPQGRSAAAQCRELEARYKPHY
jgi:hypothetical protein